MIGIESLDKTVTKMFYFGWRIARTLPVNLEPLFHKDYKQAKDVKLKKFLKSEITIDKKAFDARELNHLKNIPKSEEVPYRLDFTLSYRSPLVLPERALDNLDNEATDKLNFELKLIDMYQSHVEYWVSTFEVKWNNGLSGK